MGRFEFCFVNDRLISKASARIDPTDRGFALGDALFETMRVRGGRVVNLNAHLERLIRASELLGFGFVPDAHALSVAVEDTRAANDIVDGVLRLTVTRGSGGRGLAVADELRPTVVIVGSPRPVRPPGFRAITASVVRRNEQSPSSTIKSTNYLDNILALREATSRGADDAVLLNTHGRVVCFTAANLLARIGSVFVTPPVADGALPGTVRRHLLEQLPIKEESLTSAQLASADEIIATNCLGIRQLLELDNKAVSSEPILLSRARALYDAMI